MEKPTLRQLGIGEFREGGGWKMASIVLRFLFILLDDDLLRVLGTASPINKIWDRVTVVLTLPLYTKKCDVMRRRLEIQTMEPIDVATLLRRKNLSMVGVAHVCPQLCQPERDVVDSACVRPGLHARAGADFTGQK